MRKFIRKFRYKRYLKSEKWNKKRLAALSRDYYTCQRCGATGVILHVHHLTYKRIFHERIDDLQVLCEPCHKNSHPTW